VEKSKIGDSEALLNDATRFVETLMGDHEAVVAFLMTLDHNLTGDQYLYNVVFRILDGEVVEDTDILGLAWRLERWVKANGE
jgi:hypothetical protein